MGTSTLSKDGISFSTHGSSSARPGPAEGESGASREVNGTTQYRTVRRGLYEGAITL
jgi:hypothetical protein